MDHLADRPVCQKKTSLNLFQKKEEALDTRNEWCWSMFEHLKKLCKPIPSSLSLQDYLRGPKALCVP